MSGKHTELNIRREGLAGRITLNRPTALNALTPSMCDAITATLAAWAKDDTIALLIIDGAGDKAFCAGGDIAQVYAEGIAGNAGFAQSFWRREYHMNAALFHFPKPVVTFLHGYTMGGGVGVGCHGSHRIVDHTTRIALPNVPSDWSRMWAARCCSPVRPDGWANTSPRPRFAWGHRMPSTPDLPIIWFPARHGPPSSPRFARRGMSPESIRTPCPQTTRR